MHIEFNLNFKSIFFFVRTEKIYQLNIKLGRLEQKKKKTTAKITWLTLVFESNSTSEN